MAKVKTLHIQLELDESDRADLDKRNVTIRTFTDDLYERKERSCPLGEIAQLLQDAERDYYPSLPVEKTEIGKKLYAWLDGDERWLSTMLKPSRRYYTIVAIGTGEQNGDLAHLPWELLHDGKGFLVERKIVPVRWLFEADAYLEEPKNRSLRLLFMASSPIGVEPVLAFEQEEQTILETTKDEEQPLSLTVEESGSLNGLRQTARSNSDGHFDILHLSGHATLTDKGARFLAETESGESQLVSAEDIIEAVENREPQLFFLSGCHTGRASGATRSMAEELLQEGGNAVLGWGRAVFDESAIKASAKLYSMLSAGDTLIQALSSTYSHLINEKVDDWHQLRLYVPGEDKVAVLGALVTDDKGKREPPTYKAITEKKFANKQIVSPQAYVGQRRVIQTCLRELKNDSVAGILIHGLGGIGKTALAARLCYGFEPDYKCLVLTGKIDEIKLVEALLLGVEEDLKLCEFLKSKQSLSLKLKKVFLELQKNSSPKLIVLDEFEVNLESRDGKFLLSPKAREVLEALVAAIQNLDADVEIRHRLIITSKYKFSFEGLHEQSLGALQSADLTKKYNQCVDNLKVNGFSSKVKSEILQLSDGNPKLLQLLVKKLDDLSQEREHDDLEKLQLQELGRLKTDLGELHNSVIGEKLKAEIDQLDPKFKQSLATGLLFTLPVPRSTFIDLGFSESEIERGIALGLLKVNLQNELRVSRLLPINKIEDPEISARAAQILHEIWDSDWNKNTSRTEARMLEIRRLAKEGNELTLLLEITQSLVNSWQHRGRFRDAIELCEDTLTMTQDYQILHQLAQCETRIGKFEPAELHYQQALEFCPEENKKKRAFLLYELGTLKIDQNQLEAAKSQLQQAEELQKELQNPILETAILNSRAAICDREDNSEEAIRYLKQALDLQRETANLDLRGLGEVLQRLGEIFVLNLEEFEEAEKYLRESLEINGAIGDVRGKSMALFELGRLYQAQAKSQKSIEFYHYSLNLQKWLENYPVQAAIWYQLATIYQQHQQFKDAIECCEKALEIHTKFDDPSGKAAVENLLEEIKNT